MKSTKLNLKKLRIVSWNVNGIRALERKNNFNWLLKNNADIICLQETKAHREQLSNDLQNPKGYISYFDHSKLKKGYSGVCIYLKETLPLPEKVEYGLGVSTLDQEGRMISLFYSNIVIINCYFPNGGGEAHRLEYKLKYYEQFLKYCNKLIDGGYDVLFCGDLNVAHEEIDLARPKENLKSIGFLPEERAWVDKLEADNFVDVYRGLYPTQKDTYTWWDMKTFSRERNVGWRIDYFIVNKKIFKHVDNVLIHSNVYGSDHCPIELVFKE